MGKQFHTAHRWDLEWQDDTEVLSLGEGVQVKVFYSDPEAGVTNTLSAKHRYHGSPAGEI